MAEDDPIADLSKGITKLVNTNVNARLKRNEFRAGVLQQLENSTWEDSLSNLALSCTTPAQKSVNEASTKSYTDTLNGPADPSQWHIELEDTTKRVISEKATLTKIKRTKIYHWGTMMKYLSGKRIQRMMKMMHKSKGCVRVDTTKSFLSKSHRYSLC